MYWTRPAVLALIERCAKMEKKSNPVSRTFWKGLAETLNEMGYPVTEDQCCNKWKNLKKAYKGVKDHNAKSGNDRKDWPFLKEMDEIFGRRPEVVPLAVASTSVGLSVRETGEEPKAECSRGSKRKSKLSESHELLSKKMALEERKVKALEDFNCFFKDFIELKKAEKARAEEEL
ncbi:uncharacterized protein LOC115332247 [Ixodes scapularis]|uniref:uncharacterized protein LOC115332247 n=1 Tax=Ixodes scapularis TaxID=6945 RepID=UPI001A9F8657|nr:uncharacterized protein LOC115332247 [Ixodes scapularis]